jgi:hypothetical protein
MRYSQLVLRVSLPAIIAVLPVAAANPTMQELVTQWATFSSNKEARIVYGDSATNKICVIDLKTGTQTPIANLYAPVWPGWNWGLCYCLRWSPDGTRISFQNYDTLMVMNADGSHLRVVATYPKKSPDNTRHSWNGSDRIFYTDGLMILSILINSDNTAGHKDTIFNDRPPTDGQFSSVGASGDYVCWMDLRGNALTGGGHRDLELKISTHTIKDMVQRGAGPNGGGDGCQLIMKPDGSGTVMYQRGTHVDPSWIVSCSVDVTQTGWDSNPAWVLGHVAPLTAPDGTVCIQQEAWSNDTNYIVHMGENHAPKYAWIRKMNVSGNNKPFLYLGDYIQYPDLYVGAASTGAIEPTGATRSHEQVLRVAWISAGVMQIQVTTSGKYSVTVCDAKGAVESAHSGAGATPQDVALSHLSKGLHVVRVVIAGSTRVCQTTTLVN